MDRRRASKGVRVFISVPSLTQTIFVQRTPRAQLSEAVIHIEVK
ncbi:hypothetical protein [Cohnella cellulosilytica]